MAIVWRLTQIKISRKLTLSISATIIIISLLTIVLNIFFIDRYYIYEKNKVLENIASYLENSIITKDMIEKVEKENEVVIAYSSLSDDIDKINEEIIFSFEKNKIKLNKFWITEETIATLDEVGVSKLYDQGVSKYKVLTRFLKIDNTLYAIGMPLPYMYEAIKIINKFNILISILSILTIVLLVIILSRKIVKPLENLKELSKDIAILNFKKIDIKTNDEIEDLAISINKMSESLEKAHSEISSQNKRLKQLLSDISHELKTPLALIKVYNQGMEDGLDDGTYMDIINEQIERMNILIEKLLFWAKLDDNKLNKSKFSLVNMVEMTIDKYKLLLKQNNISFKYTLQDEENFEVYADKEMVQIVLDNLMTNAIKYTNNKEIEIILKKQNAKVELVIVNGVKSEYIKNIDELWTPFYVAEKSRNKNLSGTGLGLSIVKSILQKHKMNFEFEIIDDKILFHIHF